MENRKINLENNENKNICAECNGACCRGCSCHTHPQDVFGDKEPSFERLVEFLSSGNYQIDWWEGDVYAEFNEVDDDFHYRSRCFYIRPAHVKTVGRLFDPAWGGTCVFFEDGKGCKLSWEERPLGGKALVPSADHRCPTTFSKQDSALAWYKFNHWFDRIWFGE